MGKFKSSPLRALPESARPGRQKAVEQFAAAAQTKGTKKASWNQFDPDAKATSGLNLRLNDYELALLRHVAQVEDRSLQKTIKRLLIPALEKAARRIGGI